MTFQEPRFAFDMNKPTAINTCGGDHVLRISDFAFRREERETWFVYNVDGDWERNVIMVIGVVTEIMVIDGDGGGCDDDGDWR